MHRDLKYKHRFETYATLFAVKYINSKFIFHNLSNISWVEHCNIFVNILRCFIKIKGNQKIINFIPQSVISSVISIWIRNPDSITRKLSSVKAIDFRLWLTISYFNNYYDAQRNS